MRTPVLLTSISLTFALAAQPVLHYENVDLIGSVYDLYAITEPGESDFELEGADAEWDFTTSVVDLLGTAVITLPQFTPFAEDFPEADVVITYILNEEPSYEYVDLTPSGMDVLASFVGLSPYEVIYSDPSTALQFPFSFGQQFTDDFVANGTPGSTVRTYSGYGTLNIVLGLTENVVKVSATNGEKTWYRSDPVEPLLTISPTNAKTYWERITIGMAEQRGLVPMTLAPNPASTFFRIPGLDAAAAFRVVDALGREVVTGRVAGAQDPIDVAALLPGMYKVLVTDPRGTRTASLVKE